MNVIRHHGDDAKIVFRSVVVQTTFQHDGTHMLRQYPSPISTECYKMLPVINLKMREPPTVEGLRHKIYVGTAALGCPRS